MTDYGFRELASLTSICAIEVDRYVQGLNYDSKPLDEFKRILSDSQLKDTDNFMTVNNEDFYFAAYDSVKKGSNKTLERWSDLALEMKLLRMELGDATTSRDKGILARDILVELSRQFSARAEPVKRYLGAA